MLRDTFDILPITINGQKIKKITVDPHIRKHKDITDDIIIDLVRSLNGSEHLPDDINGPYQYFASLLVLSSKQYRLVWLLEQDQKYIGVITAYRDERKK